MPGRFFSLRSFLRDSLMLLAGTVMGLLLSRTVFDVQQPVNGLARITKGFSGQLEGTPLGLSTATPPSLNGTLPQKRGDSRVNEAVTEVLIGSAAASSSQAVVNSQPTIKEGGREAAATTRRPKTVEDELGPSAARQPLFVGVVTSKRLLLTRAAAINETWGGELGPSLRFFSSEGTQSPPNLPVVSLPGTDDTYPPQKKVYRMLKYMHDHFINDYQWFMRADDDAYVRVGPLLEFLNSLDPSADLYIGQPGIGKPDDWERIKLHPNERYCMGGPGVIISRSLLIKLAPHLDECLENVVVSWNEDLEVGRCIMRRLGVQCTWNYEMKEKFFHDYSKGEIFNSTNIYESKKLQNLLTFHPLKSPQMMLRVHQYYLELALQRAEAQVGGLYTQLERMVAATGRTRAFS